MLSGSINDFYLAGGTALSLYYFHHRISRDLDFFTKKFSFVQISGIINELALKSKRKIELIGRQNSPKKLKMAVYSVNINKKDSLKIDFVEDYAQRLKALKLINGIHVLSLEDIYLRKILCVSGISCAIDLIGRKIFQGGRQEAKDFYDLYCLSSIFMGLSGFSFKYCNPLIREGLIRWFRTYGRLDMKTVLSELKLKKEVDYRAMELHFKKEIDAILEKEVG